jgi:hypothetical protein
MKNVQFLASALKKLGYNPVAPLPPPQSMPEISAPLATGLVLQELFPDSYPAIMQQTYAEGSAATPSNQQVVFQAPSDVSAVLGVACYSQTISDQNTATWLQQVNVDMQIQQSKILSKIPLEFFYRPRQQGLPLPFVPIGRAIKVGDNITITPSSGTSAVNLIWVLFYNKSAAALI